MNSRSAGDNCVGAAGLVGLALRNAFVEGGRYRSRFRKSSTN